MYSILGEGRNAVEATTGYSKEEESELSVQPLTHQYRSHRHARALNKQANGKQRVSWGAKNTTALECYAVANAEVTQNLTCC